MEDDIEEDEPPLVTEEDVISEKDRAELVRYRKRLSDMKRKGVGITGTREQQNYEKLLEPMRKKIMAMVIDKRQRENQLPNFWECPVCNTVESSVVVDAIRCSGCGDLTPAGRTACLFCGKEVPEQEEVRRAYCWLSQTAGGLQALFQPGTALAAVFRHRLRQ